MEQIRRIMRPTDVPDTGTVRALVIHRVFGLFLTLSCPICIAPPPVCLLGLLCDLLWSDPDKDVQGWGENDRGVSFTFGADVVSKFLNRHDLDLICRAHQVISKGMKFESINMECKHQQAHSQQIDFLWFSNMVIPLSNYSLQPF